MVVAALPYTQFGTPTIEHLYTSYGTAQELTVPYIRVVAEAGPFEGMVTGLTVYGTSDSGRCSIQAKDWERVIREAQLLEKITTSRPGFASESVDAAPNLPGAKLFVEERNFLKLNWRSLVATYAGRYIAVLGTSVLDSDPDFSALADRVYRMFGYRRIFMPFVGGRKKIYRMQSPRVVR